MPKDRSTTDSSAGVMNASGTNQAAPAGVKKPRLRTRRRLKESDVNVVNKPMLKKAVGGTIVGNTMEWYDVGVFGYLITTMGPVFLPEADKAPDAVPAGDLRRHLHGPPARRGGLRLAGGPDRPPEVAGADHDHDGGVHLRHRPAAHLRGDRRVGHRAAGALPLVQGFSTGGEYAGATTFVSEYAPDKRRGFLASILDTGSYLGFALGAAVVAVLQLSLGNEAMVEWGWRDPVPAGRPAGPDRAVLPDADRGIPAVPGRPGRPGRQGQGRGRV